MKSNKKNPAEILGAKIMTVQNLEVVKGGRRHNPECQNPNQQYQGQGHQHQQVDELSLGD